MTEHKLKVRVGAHEFEAEGSAESVERQFQLWRDLIATQAATPTLPSPPPQTAPIVPVTPPPEALDGVFRKDGPVVTLAILPNGPSREPDAALLVLLGHRQLLGEDQITGTRLLQGLARSGIRVDRADRMFGEYMDQYVIRSGAHKGVRYRLTNLGMTKAQDLGRELMALLP